MYLATGHVIVWHCFICRVPLLELLSWLHRCSAWLRCSARSSGVGAGVWLGSCSAWSRPLPGGSLLLVLQYVLGSCSAWQCSAWSHPARACSVAVVEWGWAPVLIFGLNILLGVRDPIEFSLYLATGHCIVWHCFMCMVLLLELLSWLPRCSA